MTKNWKKITAENLFLFFLSKTAIYLSLGLHKVLYVQVIEEAFSSQKRPSNISQHELLQIIVYFCGSFLPSWIRIRIPNPDPQPCLQFYDTYRQRPWRAAWDRSGSWDRPAPPWTGRRAWADPAPPPHHPDIRNTLNKYGTVLLREGHLHPKPEADMSRPGIEPGPPRWEASSLEKSQTKLLLGTSYGCHSVRHSYTLQGEKANKPFFAYYGTFWSYFYIIFFQR